MRRDSRLSGVLHVLLHMAQNDGPVTSEVLARAMDTNPVVLRRVMAGLREQGLVQSEKGHGGGWTLACDLAKVTLRDVYEALGSPALLAIGNRTKKTGCLVEKAVNAALGKSFEEAESLLRSRLGEVTLATLSKHVRSHGRHGHHHEDAPLIQSDHTPFIPSGVEERDAWRRPDEVLRALELKPAMTVADVGAGAGYFAVRLARAIPRGEVIATELEPDGVRILSERARRERLPNLRAIKATPTASGLTRASVDRILLVHVWHHLADGKKYARSLAAALRPGGRLLVVDYSPTAHHGPPASMRVSPSAVIAVLEGAGLSARISPIQLPDQYIVESY